MNLSLFIYNIMQKFFTLAAIAALSFSLTACQKDDIIDIDSFVTSDNTVVTIDPEGGEVALDIDWSNMYLEVCKADVPEWLDVELFNAPARAGRDSDTGTCQVVFKAKRNNAMTRSARVRVGSMALNTSGHAPAKYYVLFEISQGKVPYIKPDLGPAITEKGDEITFGYAGASYQIECEEYSLADENGLFQIVRTPAGISIVRKSIKSGKATLKADEKTYILISK